MADGFTITVEGLQETMLMLKEVPDVIVAQGFTQALHAAARVVADVLEVRTPEKPENTAGGVLEEGELRDSLVTSVQLDSRLRGGVAEIGFGANGFVANWVEYGHRMVTHKGRVVGNVPAHPFMRPTFDITADPAIDAFAESLRETVESYYLQKFGMVA